MQDYPILDYVPEITQKIVDPNEPLALSLPTGSGKSTILPLMLLRLKIQENGTERQPKIIITVPTVVTAKSLYQRVQSLTSDTVGYAADGETKDFKTASIVYATSGFFQKFLLSSFLKDRPNPFRNFDIVIIDEFHTKSLSNTIILNVWRYCKLSGQTYTNIPRLIVSSATLNIDSIEWITNKMTINLEPKYKVETVYGGKFYTSGDLSVLNELYEKVIEFHEVNNYKGSFLVFVPGMYEIDTLYKKLKEREDLVPLRVHSEISNEEISLIYKEFEVRKIIIATNIVEAAITIENLSIVLDSMMERQSTTSDNGAIEMVTVFTSKSSATQRKGRIGRQSDGMCYRAITEEGYDSLKDTPSPEVSRVPIEREILDIQAGKLSPLMILEDKEYPELDKKIDETVVTLKFLSMIDNGIVTPKGFFASTMQLAVRNSAILYDYILTGQDPYPAIVLVAAIDNFSPNLLRIRKDQDIAKFREKNRTLIGPSDLHTLMLIMTRAESACGGWNRVRTKNIQQFVSMYDVSTSKIVDTFKKVTKIIDSLVNKSTLSSGPIVIPRDVRLPNDIGAFMETINPFVLRAYEDRKAIFSKINRNIIQYSLPGNTVPVAVNTNTKISMPIDTPMQIYVLSYRYDAVHKNYQCLLSADESKGPVVAFLTEYARSSSRPPVPRSNSRPSVPRSNSRPSIPRSASRPNRDERTIVPQGASRSSVPRSPSRPNGEERTIVARSNSRPSVPRSASRPNRDERTIVPQGASRPNGEERTIVARSNSRQGRDTMPSRQGRTRDNSVPRSTQGNKRTKTPTRGPTVERKFNTVAEKTRMSRIIPSTKSSSASLKDLLEDL